jgi:hypothetical protein
MNTSPQNCPKCRIPLRRIKHFDLYEHNGDLDVYSKEPCKEKDSVCPHCEEDVSHIVIIEEG